MKTNFKQALMPLAVVVLGVVGAFATNAKKQNEKLAAKMTGYYYDHTRPVGQKCVAIEVDCNPFSGEICTNQNPSNLIQYWGSPTEVDLQCSYELYLN